jgi:hypothetical protein
MEIQSLADDKQNVLGKHDLVSLDFTAYSDTRRTQSRTVVRHSNTGIAGSNPIRDMDEYPCIYGVILCRYSTF